MIQVSTQPTAYAADQAIDDAIGAILQGSDDVVACLDANRIPSLPLLLETSGLPHLCLFQGQLAEDAGEVAPWLVRLTRDDKLLRQLVSSAGPSGKNRFGFREAEPGIFLHSDMSLNDLRQHLRRFLRVATSDGRTFLFRFWEPGIAAVYFQGLNDRPEMIQRWFKRREGGTITDIIVPLARAEPPELLVVRAQALPAEPPVPVGQFKLTRGDVARFQQVRIAHDLERLAARLAETFPDAVAALEGETIRDFTRKGAERLMALGFLKQSFLFTLLAWELHYGPRFEARDPVGSLAEILQGDAPEAERFAQLKARMVQIG
jgi:hypothetical protein